MQLPRAFAVVAVIATMCVAPTFLASCGSAECSTTGPDATFVGRLTAVRAGAANFVVETVTVTPGISAVHVPVVGASINVAYGNAQEKFLRAGDRYQVSEAWIGGQFVSGVHVSSDACSGGTVHADGSRIDTSSATARRARHLALVLALAPVAAFTVLAAWLFVRRRGRRVTTSA